MLLVSAAAAAAGAWYTHTQAGSEDLLKPQLVLCCVVCEAVWSLKASWVTFRLAADMLKALYCSYQEFIQC